MATRRKFIESALVTSAAASMGIFPTFGKQPSSLFKIENKTEKPVVISTWHHGIKANNKAWEILNKNGKALDAVEQGVRVIESDPAITSVGYGGVPDRDGYVTLDASIMDEKGNAGSVAFLQHIMHPVSVARLIMEQTPHVMIVGEGALEFALAKGFEKRNLRTEEAKENWEKWLKKTGYKPVRFNEDNHDTIGMLALDNLGNLSGSCTTSGIRYKYHGRVADSAIIGAGLFVDNEIGAVTTTGLGESVIKIAGSYLIAEHMRMGKSPQEACEIAINRIVEKQPNYQDFQVAFIALNKYGEIGSYAIQKGFQYALYKNGKNELYDSDYFLKN